MLWVAGTAQAAVTQVEPPAKWAAYYEAVRKADTIADDEARCRAYPDLPGMQWAQGVGSGRCSILREPVLTLEQIEAILAQPEGLAELDRRYAALLEGHYKDPAQREQIHMAFNSFDHGERAQAVAGRWVKAAPGSAFAQAAAGRQRLSMATEARGENIIRDTPQQNLDRMHEHLLAATPYFSESLRIEPRLSPSCVGLAQVMRLGAGHEYWSSVVAQCVARDPDSYLTVLEWCEGATPKWGGSMEELRVMVAYATAGVARNPALGSFAGELAYAAFRNADDPDAPALAAIAATGPSASIMARTGYALASSRDHWGAFAHHSQAIRYRPANALYRYNRALLLRRFGDYDWALRDLHIASALEPQDLDYVYGIGLVLRDVEGDAAALPHFKRALATTDPVLKRQSTEMYCQALLSTDTLSEADTCTRDMVAAYPELGEAWRLRSEVLIEQDDDGRQLRPAAENFLRYANPDFRHHAAAVPRMRGILRMLDAEQPK